MPDQQNFEYLPLLRTYKGRARLGGGGGNTSPQTVANRNVRQTHSATLDAVAQAVSADWRERKAQRQVADPTLPELPAGVPILLEVDPSLDLDALRHFFDFEIIAEQEDGFVIVASEDIDMATFRDKVRGFAVKIQGSATIAEVHRLHVNDADRLARILSEHLLEIWGHIGDDDPYIVDIGIACTGTLTIPTRPKRGKRTKDAEWAEKEYTWSEKRAAAYSEWEDLQIERETTLGRFITFYQGEILHLVDGADFEAGVLPDSFTARMRISGKGLKDIVLNYPYVFELVEPEDISVPQHAGQAAAQPQLTVTPVPPSADAPAVCVIDSGIQEQHVLLQPAVDHATSHCFLPEKTHTDVSDEVAGGGHGTRVAGAVLYGEEVTKVGTPQLPCWIQNARLLDANNRLPETVFPAEAIRTIVEHYHFGPRATRIFNHSINAYGGCRLRYMSSWAAEIDALSDTHDVLVIQSAGNILPTGPVAYPGVQDHLAAGRAYPDYLAERAARVANPGQSLQALTVGSVAYDSFEQGAWRSFASAPDWPSAFTRSGPGIWDVIKPEVVEYGGDFIHTSNQPPDVQGGGGIPATCPELVRSTLATPGPAVDRDATGTSFAAPKVARIAAALQTVLPDETTLLYRALIVQSAQWPEWAEGVLS
ncbi:MAG: S8 family peptidase, partial [Ramlibacter sp.]|nr:S8 family peptidase [Ramlibacter sp.]